VSHDACHLDESGDFRLRGGGSTWELGMKGGWGANEHWGAGRLPYYPDAQLDLAASAERLEIQIREGRSRGEELGGGLGQKSKQTSERALKENVVERQILT